MKITIPYYEDNTRISNSNIGMYIKNGPSFLKGILDGTQEGLNAKYLEKGSMIHKYILEPDDFWNEYEILDFEIPKSKQMQQFAKDYVKCNDPFTDREDIIRCYRKAYKCDKMSDDKVLEEAQLTAAVIQDYITYLSIEKEGKKKVMSWSDHNMLKTIKKNLEDHKKAYELLYNQPNTAECFNEFHINWDYPKLDEDLSIDCKSLLDRLIIDHHNKKIILVDLKTTVSVTNFAHSMNEYDYRRQLAYYWLAIHWYFKNIIGLEIAEYEVESYIIAIQNNDGYAVRVFKIEPESIEERLHVITDTLKKILWHKTTNQWDHYREYYEGDGAEVLT